VISANTGDASQGFVAAGRGAGAGATSSSSTKLSTNASWFAPAALGEEEVDEGDGGGRSRGSVEAAVAATLENESRGRVSRSSSTVGSAEDGAAATIMATAGG
jgi:hypothetical protein